MTIQQARVFFSEAWTDRKIAGSKDIEMSVVIGSNPADFALSKS
jgi:hypothetical protein